MLTQLATATEFDRTPIPIRAIRHKPPFDKGFDPAAKSAVQGFMTRDEEKRLGCGKYGKQDIQSHPFFKSIDWGKLERRELKPPFTPNQGDKKDAANFDEEFTNEDPRVSPGNPRAVSSPTPTRARLVSRYCCLRRAFWAAAEAGPPRPSAHPCGCSPRRTAMHTVSPGPRRSPGSISSSSRAFRLSTRALARATAAPTPGPAQPRRDSNGCRRRTRSRARRGTAPT